MFLRQRTLDIGKVGVNLGANGPDRDDRRNRDERCQQRVLDDVLAILFTNETLNQMLHKPSLLDEVGKKLALPCFVEEGIRDS